MVLHDSHHMSDSGLGSESEPSSAAVEDVLDLPDAFVNPERLRQSVHEILDSLGEDVNREGLKDTPKRVAKAWLAASEGYAQNVHSVLGGALFHEGMGSQGHDSIVLIRDVDFASTSEHTLLPFFGRCHIAYIPREGLVLGLSKVARLAKMFAKRFQNQQHFTCQMLDAFNAEVQPLGCAAIVEASHMGEEEAGSKLTVACLGCFYAHPRVYIQEFACLLGRPELAERLVDLARGSGSTSGAHENSTHGAASSPAPARDSSMDCSTTGRMEAAVESMLREIGEDPLREGLQGSAGRYVRHLMASTSGKEHAAVGGSVHVTSHRIAERMIGLHPGQVQCFELRFASQCEHHLLPFHGSLQVLVLLPSSTTKLLAAEAVRWIVNTFSKRLQIQERLTHQIAEAIQSSIEVQGLLVVCRAAHMCMVARGVEQHASTTMTSASYGTLKSNHQLRIQALHCLQASQLSC